MPTAWRRCVAIASVSSAWRFCERNSRRQRQERRAAPGPQPDVESGRLAIRVLVGSRRRRHGHQRRRRGRRQRQDGAVLSSTDRQLRSAPTTVLFSPDGKHVVRFGRQPNQAAGIFVNGTFTQTGAGNVWAPIFTPDSRHLFWVERVRPGGRMAFFLDGKVVAQFDHSTLVAMPNWIGVGSDGVLTAVVVDGLS